MGSVFRMSVTMSGQRLIFRWTWTVLAGACVFAAEPTSAQTLEEKLEAIVKPLKDKADQKTKLPEVNVAPPPLTDEEKRTIGKQKAMEKFDKQIELDALKGSTR